MLGFERVILTAKSHEDPPKKSIDQDFSVSYWVLRFTKGNKITNSESVSEDET